MSATETDAANLKAAIDMLNRTEGFDPPQLLEPRFWSDWKVKHAVDAIAKARAEGRNEGLEAALQSVAGQQISRAMKFFLINDIRALKTEEPIPETEGCGVGRLRE